MKIIATSQDRDKWLDARKQGITASDAPAVLGLNPHKTPFAVWAEKVGYTEPKDLSDNEAVQWGNKLESLIAEGFAAKQGVEVVQSGELIQHEKYPHILATPDYWVSGDKILECKYTSQKWLYSNNQTPDHHHAQVLVQLAVTGKLAGYIAALCGKLEIRVIERDYAAEQAIISELCKFWELVQDRVPPPMSGNDLEVVGEIYPYVDPALQSTLDASHGYQIEQYLNLKEQIKKLDNEKDVIEANLKFVMGSSCAATCGDYKITRSEVQTSRLDTKKIKDLYPDIYNANLNFTRSTRFTVKKQ